MQNKYYLSGSLTENFNIRLDDANMLKRVLGPWLEKPLLIELSVLKSKRTDKQNRYLHAVIVPSVQRWHYETQGTKLNTEECKAYIYKKVLGHSIETKQILGEEVFFFIGKHFSEMDTVEFNEAKELVQAFFAPLGCDIPDPREENLNNNFLKK
jgi:NinB protein